MNYHKLIKESYIEAIALDQTIPLDLRSALRSHERMPLFLDNLAKQLAGAQANRIKSNKDALHEAQIKSIVYDFTKIFIDGVKREAENRYKSDVKKQLEMAQAQMLKDLDATASGKISGEYQEIFSDGVTATTDRSV